MFLVLVVGVVALWFARSAELSGYVDFPILESYIVGSICCLAAGLYYLSIILGG